MKTTTLTLAIAAVLSLAPNLKAAVSIAHVENTGAGRFLDWSGAPLTSGGVSIGFFPGGGAPADSAFGSTILG